MKIKTSELSGERLNWAVAIAVGLKPFVQAAHYGAPNRVFVEPEKKSDQEGAVIGNRYKPSTDWGCCGQLIDKYFPTFSFADGLIRAEVILASGEPFSAIGPNYLVAACRAIVAVKLGDEVEVPDALI